MILHSGEGIVSEIDLEAEDKKLQVFSGKIWTVMLDKEVFFFCNVSVLYNFASGGSIFKTWDNR
jgi:hypothetical protein